MQSPATMVASALPATTVASATPATAVASAAPATVVASAAATAVTSAAPAKTRKLGTVMCAVRDAKLITAFVNNPKAIQRRPKGFKTILETSAAGKRLGRLEPKMLAWFVAHVAVEAALNEAGVAIDARLGVTIDNWKYKFKGPALGRDGGQTWEQVVVAQAKRNAVTGQYEAPSAGYALP
jgi:hypothetical protein